MKVYPFGTIELKEKNSDHTFKVNGHRVKPYYEGVYVKQTVECLEIKDCL